MILPPGLSEAYRKNPNIIIRLLPKQNRSPCASLSGTVIFPLRHGAETAVFCQAEGASFHGQRNLWHRLQYSDRSRRNQPCPYASLSGRRRICKKAARLLGLRLTVLKEDPSAITLLLSCSSMPTGDFHPACGLLKQVIDSF